jgi:predicted CXXCH cytochrome family protein
MVGRGSRWTSLALAGAVAVTIHLGWPQAAPDNQYVDARTCARCHREIDESYRKTGMARSLFRPSPANTVEDYTRNEFYHSTSDTHYAMVRRDGDYYQRRWQIGFGGKETNVEELKIDYVLGSGAHARSYLHRTPRGSLIELPLGWYAEKGGYWGMSPGFDTAHPITRRLTSYECVFCHTAYPQIPAGHENSGSEPVFVGEMPAGIDCQRCHGPGGKHVRLTQTPGVKPADVRSSIVNPARLDSKAQMEVCMQCHLEPTTTRLPSILRRFDRGPFSFTPGEPLERFALFFDHAPGSGRDDKFEIASSAYRLRQSRCFLESKETLTCQSCHDPHRIPRGEAAVQHYSAVCRQCHGAVDALVSSARHPAGGNCVSCHMPSRRTEDVVHVVMTDHKIVRRPPERDLLAERAERHPTQADEYHGEVVPYYPSPLPKTGENALYRAVAQVALENNLQSGLADLTREIARQQPRDPDFYNVLGAALRAGDKPSEAAAAFEQSLRLRPNSTAALRSMADAWRAAGKPERSAEALSRAVRVDPADALSWLHYGMLESELGRSDSALEKVEKAIALNPDLPGEYSSLAGILLALGQVDRAGAALREGLRGDPYDSTAHDLTGRVFAVKGATAEALYHFEKANRLRPGYGPHLYDYALMLTKVSRFDEAQQSAEAAIAANPDQAEAHALLGQLLARKRQPAEAIREYRQAVRLQPELSRTRLDLASALAAQGDRSGAVEQLREAAKGRDPAVAGQATRALQQLGVE